MQEELLKESQESFKQFEAALMKMFEDNPNPSVRARELRKDLKLLFQEFHSRRDEGKSSLAYHATRYKQIDEVMKHYVPDSEFQHSNFFQFHQAVKKLNIRQRLQASITGTSKEIKKCAHKDCHNSENLKKCSACLVFAYCSVSCQRSDWKTHKTICPVVRKRLESSEIKFLI